ncbi:11437_t:CDS:1, partial [Cetraspora pellucida]
IPAYNKIPYDIKLQRNIYNGLRQSIPKHVPQLVADTISVWNNISDESSEIAAQVRKADEIIDLNMSISSHFNIYVREVYTNRRFKPLNATGL